MERRTERKDVRRDGWAEMQFLGEQMDGLWTRYRKDGSKHWEREYVAGQQNGYELTWDERGRLIDEKWFLDGELHGPWRIWDSTGVFRQHSNFVQGEQEGLQSWWDAAGNPIAQGTITTGVRAGTFVADVLNEAETATKRMVMEWRDGQLISDLRWG